MSTYNVSFDTQSGILNCSFGLPSDNDEKVIDARNGCIAVKDAVMQAGLKVLRVNGAASLPVSFVIAHEFCHIVPAVAVFDPKIDGGSYVVSISHTPEFKVGDVIK